MSETTESLIEEEIEESKVDLSFWKNFAKYLKPYKKEFIYLILLMLVLGGLDAIFPLLNKFAIDNFVEAGSIEGLEIFAIIFGIGVLLMAATVYAFIAITGKVEAKMAYDIRKLGFEKLQTLSLSYYDEKAAGWLMARMTSDVNRLTEIISWGLVDVAWGIALMAAVLIAMFSINVKLAFATLAIVPILIIASVYFQKRILITQREVRKTNSKITAAYNEDIQGAKTTKTLARENINLEEFSVLTNSMRDKSIRAVKISAIYIPIVIILGSVGTALVISIGGHDILKGAISYGTLVAFISYATQFFEPINQIAVIFAEMQTAQASAERIFALLNEEPTIKDSIEVTEKYGDILSPNRENWPSIKGNVEFKDVEFYYNKEEIILDKFNLKVNAGETIALVGETGSGKSTIVNLICRFYEPTNGKILIDGNDYKSLPQNWIHENLGYVLQSPHLFSGTIKENILYGNLDATEDDIINASKLVNAHDFIVNMKDGYNSEVGEGGALLSTGQKQLISFARAIIRNPRLFVLDEATSSIDTETEQIIQNAIGKVLEGRTSFVIAHRLSTIRNSDKILVIRKGKITEMGSHKELLKQKGYYYNLYTNQFIEEQSKNILK